MFHPESLPLPIRWSLHAASIPYGLAVRIRNGLFEQRWKAIHHVSVPVISIGNLSMGGTGKTPCVEYVASYLREKELQVCLLSRGYKSTDSGMNDEAMLLEENLPDVPHLQNPDRVLSAKTAVEELEAEVLVLDDGFQHRRLHRDLDIVLIDVTRPPHKDWLFPGGTLRESISSLRRADVVILTRCDLAEANELEAISKNIQTYLRSNVPIVRSIHQPLELIRVDADPLEMSTLNGRTLGMVCGIGNPAAFRKTLQSVGAVVSSEKVFPDHHGYTRNDVQELEKWAACLPSDAWIAVTQKDHVKLRIGELSGRPVVAARVGLAITKGENELKAKIDQAVSEIERKHEINDEE